MSFLTNDDLMKRLKALGLTDADGKPVVSARVDARSVTSGSVQTTEQTLNSVTLPAGALGPGRALRISGGGTTAANANNKTLTLYLGTDDILASGTITDNAKDFGFEVIVIRTGVDTQIAFGRLWVAGALVAAASISYAGTQDESTALDVTLKSANGSAAAASATGKGLTVEVLG